MTGFATDPFLRNLAWSAVGIVVVLAATYIVGRIVGKHSVIDTAWGLLFTSIALVSFISSAGEGNTALRWTLLVLTAAWGLRLAVHIGRRTVGKPEDPRYEKMLDGKSPLYAFVVVYVSQGLLAFLISMPVQVGMFERGGLTVFAYVGIAIWAIGVVFEAVGDAQLEKYKAIPKSEKPPVLDTGLWRYTRHPNYFGDAAVWTGVFLVAVGHWPGILTLPSLAIMIYLLAFGSGKRVLERTMSKRPAYRDYMDRTSGFFPLPPRSTS